jgi:putative membrane protein
VLHTDARFHTAVEEAVGRLEETTDAEIIVVAARKSGSYRDFSFGVASAVAVLTLLALLAVPYPVHPWLLPVELVVVWGLVAWGTSDGPVLRAILPESRRARQVREAAHAEFHREQVHATPHRTGVLIYVSALEGRIEVLPDLGLEGRIPGPVWREAVSGFAQDDLDAFLAALDRLGAVLAEHMPALEVDLVDLPNAPRVRA